MPILINTARFGHFTVNDEDVVSFPKGIPGFETHKEWALAGEEDNPIKWLQSLSDGDVALPVVVPDTIKSNYNAVLPEGSLSLIEAETVDDLALLIVVSIPPGAPWNMTANLRAPLVINHKKRIGRQIITENEEYELRVPVLSDIMRESMRKKAAAGAPSEAAPEE
ncbi:MAG: flagellar assembly protein FliW [Verrucomicrobiae bacterium]|nr:flagellar assembly protein FliW [Verrucomicrobiae bacterium]